MYKLIIKILPYILICLIFIYDHMYPYKDFMPLALCILFPAIYIFQGILYSKSNKQALIGFVCSSTLMFLFLALLDKVVDFKYTNSKIRLY